MPQQERTPLLEATLETVSPTPESRDPPAAAPLQPEDATYSSSRSGGDDYYMPCGCCSGCNDPNDDHHQHHYRHHRARACIGGCCLAVVVVLWVASAELEQAIFTDTEFNKPFALTYLDASSFAAYLIGFALRPKWRRQFRQALQVVRYNMNNYYYHEVGTKRERKKIIVNNAQKLIINKTPNSGYADKNDGILTNDGNVLTTATSSTTYNTGGTSTVKPPNARADTSSTTTDSATTSTTTTTHHSTGHHTGGIVSLSESFRLAVPFCLLWFAANYTYNISLGCTSVATNTILSSTSGVFTLLLGACFPGDSSVDRFSYPKLLATLASIGGVAMVALSDGHVSIQNNTTTTITTTTIATTGTAIIADIVNGISGSDTRENALTSYSYSAFDYDDYMGGDTANSAALATSATAVVTMTTATATTTTATAAAIRSSSSNFCGGTKAGGDALALTSALLYAMYLILLRRRVKTRRIDMPLFLACVGVCSALLLWPVLLLLHATNIEPLVLPSPRVAGFLVLNSLLGTVLSELLWLYATLLTSPLIATLALSLTIPLAMAADAILAPTTGPGGGSDTTATTLTPLYGAGAAVVTLSFVIVNLDTYYPHQKWWLPCGHKSTVVRTARHSGELSE